MTIAEFRKWCEENNVPDEAVLRGLRVCPDGKGFDIFFDECDSPDYDCTDNGYVDVSGE